jgi:hypothetical protein
VFGEEYDSSSKQGHSIAVSAESMKLKTGPLQGSRFVVAKADLKPVGTLCEDYTSASQAPMSPFLPSSSHLHLPNVLR